MTAPSIRVCHVVRQYHPSVGGLESFVAALARHLTLLGCRCDVLTLDRRFEHAGPRLPTRETVDDIEISRVPMIGIRRYFTPQFKPEILASYDVIHVHGMDGFFERIARMPRRTGQILILTTHGVIFHTKWLTPLKRAYFHLAFPPLVARYDRILANSENDAALMRRLGVEARLTPNGVVPFGDFTATGLDLLYVGRLSSHKQVDRLIDVLAQPPLADARLHIIGPAWDVKEAALTDHARSKGVETRVIVHGSLEPRALAQIAAQCGVFVSASGYEGFGLSLIEAMGVGLVPVVQSNEAFDELIGKASIGKCVDFAQPCAAAHAIRNELDLLSPARRQQARAFAANYTWPTHARTTHALYLEALDQARRVSA